MLAAMLLGFLARISSDADVPVHWAGRWGWVFDVHALIFNHWAV
jgi:hypothetical protein